MSNRLSKLDQAIANLEGQIKVLQLALQHLQDQRVEQPKLRRPRVVKRGPQDAVKPEPAA